MISYIKGTVNLISDGFIILECSGIGYKINMPVSSLYKVSEGQSACVYTFMSVKDDGISLFGFMSEAERTMFELLTGVSGIGPKGALGILSSISVNELKMAVAAEDFKLISSAKGIGNKTAQRIIIELKGKIEGSFASESDLSDNSEIKTLPASKAYKNAADVLEALGFSRTSSVRALNLIENAENLSSEELVNEALKVIE